MAATAQDEKIARLIAKYGHAGYGLWWLVVEAVAARLEGDGDPSVTYHISKWSHILSIRGSDVKSSLSKLASAHLATVERIDSEIKVTIPNLLKYRDEYSRKSGHTPESVRSKKQIQKQKQIQSTEAEEEAAAETSELEGDAGAENAAETPPPTTEEIKNQLRNFAAAAPPRNGASTPEDRTAMQARLKQHEWTRAALTEYPGTNRLPGKPDDAIIRRCLDVAHGDTAALGRSLECMYRAGKAPSLSWAWFPTVIAQYLESP